MKKVIRCLLFCCSCVFADDHLAKASQNDVGIESNNIVRGPKISKSSSIIEIGLRHTHLINLDSDAGSVFISDPEIADVQVLSPRVVCVWGLKNGEASLVINDKNHKNLLMATLKIGYNLDSLYELISTAYPDAKVSLKSMNDALMVSGTVADAKVASDIMSILTKACGDDAKILNNMKVQSPSQVLLKVKIAEVKRSVVKNFGINWVSFLNHSSGLGIGLITAGLTAAVNTLFGMNSSGGGSSGGASGGGGASAGTQASIPNGLLQVNKNTFGTLSPSDAGMGRWVAGYTGNDSIQFSAILDALANESMAVILAEPTLVAQSGKTAIFKAGGEKGYLVASTSVGTAPTTEFKEWGTSIEFTPVVMDGNRIHMKVHPKVSSLVTDVGTNDIPSLNSREVETTVELNSGQSIAIAGLLQVLTTNMSYSTSPFAGLPVIGGLFRSSKKAREETELVVIVTPYIVQPTSKELRTPVDNLPRMFSPLSQSFSGKFMSAKGDTTKKLVVAEVLPHVGHIIR